MGTAVPGRRAVQYHGAQGSGAYDSGIEPTLPAVVNTQYELVDVATLEHHPENPRRGNVDVLAESVRANGFFGALLVQTSTRRVLVGNHRLRAARAEGLTQVPVVWADVDDDRARRIMVADNRTTDLAGWDEAGLVEVLRSLDGDLVGTGFTTDNLEDLVAKLNAPSLEDLTARMGEYRDEDGWWTLRLPLPPEVADRYRELMAEQEGDDEWQRFAHLIG